MGIKYIINNNDNTITNQFVNGGLSATTLSATTIYLSGNNLTSVIDSLNNYLPISGGTITGDLYVVGSLSGDGTYITNIDTDNIPNLVSLLSDKTDLTLFTTHTSAVNPHGTSFYDLNNSGHTHTISDVTSLQTSLDSKTNLTSFSSHTGNTNNPHNTTFNNLVSTAHTHTISDISDLNTQLNNKFDKSGGTINGNLSITGNFTVIGTATTINTETLSVTDNLLVLNSNLTGSTSPFIGESGVEVLRGSATTASLIWSETNTRWEAGLTGSTKQILLSGDSLSLLNSGHTHSISDVTSLESSLFFKFDKSGGTITGSTTFTNGLSGNTISGVTFYGDGSNLSGLYQGFTGGTVTGDTTFVTGLTANTLVTTSNISSNSLSGTTDRIVQVNSGGTLSAERDIISAYITDGGVQALLDNVSNWNPSGVYTGTTITGTYQGQKYYNSNYFFEAVDNNLWIRLSRV